VADGLSPMLSYQQPPPTSSVWLSQVGERFLSADLCQHVQQQGFSTGSFVGICCISREWSAMYRICHLTCCCSLRRCCCSAAVAAAAAAVCMVHGAVLQSCGPVQAPFHNTKDDSLLPAAGAADSVPQCLFGYTRLMRWAVGTGQAGRQGSLPSRLYGTYAEAPLLACDV